MYEFWYDYVKRKIVKVKSLICGNRQFNLYIKTDDIYINIAEDVETTFDTLNYELD